MLFRGKWSTKRTFEESKHKGKQHHDHDINDSNRLTHMMNVQMTKKSTNSNETGAVLTLNEWYTKQVNYVSITNIICYIQKLQR